MHPFWSEKHHLATGLISEIEKKKFLNKISVILLLGHEEFWKYMNGPEAKNIFQVAGRLWVPIGSDRLDLYYMTRNN